MDKFDLMTLLKQCLDHAHCEDCPLDRQDAPGCGTMMDTMTDDTARELLAILEADVQREKKADDLHEEEIRRKDAAIRALESRADGGLDVHGVLKEMERMAMEQDATVSYSCTERQGARTMTVTVCTGWMGTEDE